MFEQSTIDSVVVLLYGNSMLFKKIWKKFCDYWVYRTLKLIKILSINFFILNCQMSFLMCDDIVRKTANLIKSPWYIFSYFIAVQIGPNSCQILHNAAVAYQLDCRCVLFYIKEVLGHLIA